MRFFLFAALLTFNLGAEPVKVKQTQGAARGFLVVRDASGKQVGTGDVQQIVSGSHITSRMVYSFNDGSLDAETTVFTQARVFHVLSDRHIQSGPLFEKPIDITFDSAKGVVTTKEPGKPGSRKQKKEIPADVANGITGTILLNLAPNVVPFELPMIAPTLNGRLIKIHISREGEEGFTIGGARYKAAIFRIHPNLGGLEGAVAPLLGKEPKDALVWVLESGAPALVREVAQFSVGGPMFSVELAGTRFAPLGSDAK